MSDTFFLNSYLYIIVLALDILFEFWDDIRAMSSNDQKKKILKAKIAVALQDELGRIPNQDEVERICLLTRVMFKAVLGLHYLRQEQKESGQLPIF